MVNCTHCTSHSQKRFLHYIFHTLIAHNSMVVAQYSGRTLHSWEYIFQWCILHCKYCKNAVHSTVASGVSSSGVRLTRKAEFPFWKKSESLWKRRRTSSCSYSPLWRARAVPSFFTCSTAPVCNWEWFASRICFVIWNSLYEVEAKWNLCMLVIDLFTWSAEL